VRAVRKHRRGARFLMPPDYFHFHRLPSPAIIFLFRAGASIFVI
jgi:hypothetical protein